MRSKWLGMLWYIFRDNFYAQLANYQISHTNFLESQVPEATQVFFDFPETCFKTFQVAISQQLSPDSEA